MDVYQFINSYEQALHSQKWENVEPLFHENATVEFSNGKKYFGINEIEKAFKTNFKLIKNEAFKISNVKIIDGNENTITYSFQFHWNGIIEGKNTSGEGKGTTEIIRYKNKWVISKEKLYK